MNERDITSTASIKSREQAVAHARLEAKNSGTRYVLVSSIPDIQRTGDGVRGYGLTVKYDYFCTDEKISRVNFITYEAEK